MVAAGVVCWRRTPDGELELLLVHSARWGDWSWPKGKRQPGETLPETAVREVREESGVRAELGRRLPAVSYLLPDGTAKTVHYWVGQALDSGPRTASATEITDVAWFPVPAARERLTRPSDRPLLDALLALAERGRLETRPLLVLRHAKARKRANWPGEEADRPLTRTGLGQAESLPGLLACWSPQRLLSSPWHRCTQSLQPYLDRREPITGRVLDPPELVPLLSEQGLRNHPERIGPMVTGLLADDRSALICTHRPVLAAVIETLAESTALAVRNQLPQSNPWLAPAEILVVHTSFQLHARRVISRIHSVEFYRGEPVRSARG